MNILKIDICPLCGKKHFQKLMTCTDHYATGENFDVYMCDSCGFIFTQHAPCEAEIGRYYDSPDYISHSNTHKGLMNKVYHWVRQYMLISKAHLIKHHSGLSRGILLDIGTGTGYFAHAMQSKGWRVRAIEKNEATRKFAADNFGIQVDAPGALESYEDASFDVVTLWHVMEHLEQLNETWAQLSRILKDRGILVVAVPNPRSYDAAKYKEQWAAYDVPRHLWHSTPAVMQQFGAKYGFILADQRPMPFDAFYVSMLSEKYQKHAFPFLRGMIVGIKAWFSTLINKERSSSMIYVFRKKQ